MQIKDDMEKDIFLDVVAEEADKIKDTEIKEIVKKRANTLFALVFDFSNKGLIADTREMRRKLKSVIEEG